ncbi:MAG: acyl-CoA thioesterase [Lachnospiraceae bacterium]|nr:acyl-CoA thioesterase [Lachnospiraceae bacterium]MCD7765211.1 acyl-CoA thioesterase [Lachnospiraceae bacterium]
MIANTDICVNIKADSAACINTDALADTAEKATAPAVGITPWIHKVQYYETDQMQVVHHSNFIRWFEECRVHILDEIGYGYDTLEAEGIASPVLTINAKIVKSVRFGETVKIRAAIEKFDGIRLTIKYEVLRDGDDMLCCTGETGHCFLGKDGQLISLKRKFPKVYEAFLALPTEFI